MRELEDADLVVGDRRADRTGDRGRGHVPGGAEQHHQRHVPGHGGLAAGGPRKDPGRGSEGRERRRRAAAVGIGLVVQNDPGELLATVERGDEVSAARRVGRWRVPLGVAGRFAREGVRCAGGLYLPWSRQHAYWQVGATERTGPGSPEGCHGTGPQIWPAGRALAPGRDRGPANPAELQHV